LPMSRIPIHAVSNRAWASARWRQQ
jgi:hypothetical protein